tara:strand:- start:68 stop:388 length:321 start_codon:yes stop_codon:yes gene_type:complete
MSKPNLQRWETSFQDNKISVTNWWNWSLQVSADLYINGELVDSSDGAFPDINKPLLKAYEYNETIKSLEVFIAGTFSVKISIMVNGENIHQDSLNFLDRLILRFLN